jgi:hypothetical protein
VATSSASSSGPALMIALYKAPFRLGPASGRHMPSLLPRILSWGRLFPRWLVESGRGVRHSRPLPLSILSGSGRFRRNSHWRILVFIARLRLSSVESLAGYLHSWPFGLSRSSHPNAVEIPGTPAGRLHSPWHAPEVIPTTLVPETGEVSWVCMGLRWVLFLTKVLFASIEVPGFFIRPGSCWP